MKVVVIARDQVNYVRRCVDGLLHAGLQVHIVDHGSTYEPMTRWLKTQAPEGGVTVHWKPNAHPRDIWFNGTLHDILTTEERYIVTDADIEPPADPAWVSVLGQLLDGVPYLAKAGCGLITHDLPDHFEHADRVRMWEANYQNFHNTHVLQVNADEARGVPDGRIWYYRASVDTTLAMYPAWDPDRHPADRFALDPSVRTARERFMVRHLPWYIDSANPPQEVAYYREHATPGVSMWADPDNHDGQWFRRLKAKLASPDNGEGAHRL